MIYKLTRSWLKKKIDYFNTTVSGIDNQLREINTNLDINFLPANLKDKTYLIKFDRIRTTDELEDYESSNRMRVIIEFMFGVYNQNVIYYQKIVDEYLWKLHRIIESSNVFPLNYKDESITPDIILFGLEEIGINNLTRLDKAGKYLIPTIEFELGFIDETNF